MTARKLQELSLYAIVWPIFLEQFLQILLGNIDTLMLSRYSDQSVASVGIANQFLNVAGLAFGFITIGTGILANQMIGANRQREVGQIFSVALYLVLALGGLLSLALVFSSTHLFQLVHTPTELIADGEAYLVVVGGFLFLQGLIMIIGTIMRSHGLMKETMLVSMGMNIVNIIGNFFFLTGTWGVPVLGVTGVAISTITSRLLGFLILYWIAYRKLGLRLPQKGSFSLISRYLRGILTMGLPSAGEQISYSLFQVMVTSFIAIFGAIALTTKVYTENLLMFVIIFTISIGIATQLVVGQLIGGGDKEKAYAQALRSLKWTILITMIVETLLYFVSEPLLGLFTQNPEIIALGQKLILLSILLEPGRACNVVIIASLNAAGDVRFPVIVGIGCMWLISVPLAYLVGVVFELGLIGIWISFIIDEWVRGLLMVRRWRQKKWQQIQLVQREKEESEQELIVSM